jgi:hypothetical protein
VFKTVILSILKILPVLPGAIASVYGVIQAAEKFGFDKLQPNLHAKLLNCGNLLLEALVGYWRDI